MSQLAKLDDQCMGMILSCLLYPFDFKIRPQFQRKRLPNKMNQNEPNVEIKLSCFSAPDVQEIIALRKSSS